MNGCVVTPLYENRQENWFWIIARKLSIKNSEKLETMIVKNEEFFKRPIHSNIALGCFVAFCYVHDEQNIVICQWRAD